MFYFLKSLINKIGYPARNTLKFTRRIKNLKNEPKDSLFQNQNLKNEEQRLIRTYDLEKFYHHSKILTYKENLYILKLLEDTFENFSIHWQQDTLNILDIGSKNFSYATALHKFFVNYKTNTQRNVYLDGIEVDAYRIMADLHSRYDYAQYHIKNLPHTRFIVEDLLNYTSKKYHFITWFLPFIIKKPLINWGLPAKYFQPEKMLEHTCKLLENGGIILIVNQSGIEKGTLLKLLSNLKLPFTTFEKPYTNSFSPFSYDRYITLIKKELNG